MIEARRRTRICLVAPNALGELSGVQTGHVGGSEHGQASMARWLARRGHDVSMVTWDAAAAQHTYDGVRVIKLCAPDAGIRGLRFLHPRWTSLSRALRRADADIYHYCGGDLTLGQITFWCRRHGKRSAYSVSSDVACDAALRHLEPLRERLLYRYGLRRVDLVTVQTHQQREMLRAGFGIAAHMVGTPNDTSSHAPNTAGTEGAPRVLWIGRFSQEKRPDRLLDVAERLPQVHFDMVGGTNQESAYASAVTRRAAKLANVTVHGKIPRTALAPLYQGAAILCCTSDYEGFPQVFIEAWRSGVPVVSTVDPDGVIARFGLGRVAADADGVAVALAALAASTEDRRRASDAVRNYAVEHCSLDATMLHFEKLFLDLASGRSAGNSDRGE